MKRGPRIRALKTWACGACGLACQPVSGKGKVARTCQRCGAVAVRAFASKTEYRWLLDLLTQQKLGIICNLEVQPVFPLVINGVSVGKYTADYAYEDAGIRKVVDVKGMMTDEAAFRIKVAEAVHGIRVEIVR